MPRLLDTLCAATLVATLSACAGHGAALAPAGPPGLGPQSKALTTYSVFVGNNAGEPVVDVVPFGQASNVAGAVPAKSPGYVIYPDGSTQSLDAFGSFDASQSSWTLANLDSVIANPANEPLVDVVVNDPSNPAPQEVVVNVYAPPAGLNASDAVRELSSTAQADITGVTVVPQNATVADGRSAPFLALAHTSDGAVQPLSSAAWAVSRAAGCGTAAGSIKTPASDASKVLYLAPATGTATVSCPDVAVATYTSSAASHTSSANVFFYDPKSALKLAGILKDSAGKPVANATINLYGGGAEAQRGTLLVRTDSAGKFQKLVPPNRFLYPVVAQAAAGKVTYSQVNPSSLNPATAGAALATQTWTLGAIAASVGPKHDPPYDTLVRDTSYYGDLARAQFPFGMPDTHGTFAAGSIEAILVAPHANATGRVTTGAFAGYTYAWNPAGTVATFTQPVTGSQQRVLAVTIASKDPSGKACTSAIACFTFTQNAGKNLEFDGGWSQTIASNAFNVSYVRNVYSASHQQSGSPLYKDAMTFSQTLGATTLTFSINRTNASGKSLGSVSTTRTGAAAPALYTFAGLAHSLVYKSNGTIDIAYAISNGTQNADYSAGWAFTISQSPSKSDVGDKVTWNAVPPSQADSSGTIATGTIDVPNLTGLVSGHAASFKVAPNGKVTLTKDAALGGNVLTFQL